MFFYVFKYAEIGLSILLSKDSINVLSLINLFNLCNMVKKIIAIINGVAHVEKGLFH